MQAWAQSRHLLITFCCLLTNRNITLQGIVYVEGEKDGMLKKTQFIVKLPFGRTDMWIHLVNSVNVIVMSPFFPFCWVSQKRNLKGRTRRVGTQEARWVRGWDEGQKEEALAYVLPLHFTSYFPRISFVSICVCRNSIPNFENVLLYPNESMHQTFYFMSWNCSLFSVICSCEHLWIVKQTAFWADELYAFWFAHELFALFASLLLSYQIING